ncbi:hypothetical protein V6N13_037492 [Hibiscus sabdariffa]
MVLLALMPMVVGIAISFVLLVSICGIIVPTSVSFLNLALATTRLTGLLLCLPSRILSELKLLGFSVASGFVGSIMLLWIFFSCHFQFIHCRISNGFEYFLTTFVYASPHSRQRNDLWIHLRALASSVSEPWSIIGDFNATLFNRDRKGYSSSFSDSAFQHMAFDCGLHELDYFGPDYTWYRGNCSVRLDRCFVTENWDASQPLVDAIESFSTVATDWNQEVFGSIGRNKRIIMARLHGVQRCLDQRRTRGLLKVEQKLLDELESLLDYEEQLWKQKSRMDWINSGDRNTKYFHSKAIARRRHKTISKLKLGSGD